MDKRLKDPIYGYIDIPMEYMENVIDTAVFQRLRRVMQTSYAPLFSSAIHNRFVHSIGVFYLGKIAAAVLKRELLKNTVCDEDTIQKYADIYQAACLLHDVGHAPFSHTGEGFYKTDDYKTVELHKRLLSVTGSPEFQKDIPKEESQAAAPHEIMSSIIGIKEFGDFLLKDNASKEFFARCITGYRYSEAGIDNDIRNCFITMLNSKVIDVDRLDYLIRDAYITGFETVNIDYMRLLQALTVVSWKGRYQTAYYKDALSVIENAVYAHDAEKKWIQNHPVVLYECYLLKHIITCLNEKLNHKNRKLFSAEAMSSEGIVLKNRVQVSLLCDDDIIYLFKNMLDDDISKEFFERRKRRHPVWKSEAEYKAYIGSLSLEGRLKDEFLDCLKSFVGGNQKDMQMPITINTDLEAKLEKELEDSEKQLENVTNEMDRISFQRQNKGTKDRLNLCRYLNGYAKDHGLKDDFIIIRTDMFNSGFSKSEITKLLNVFKQGEDKIVKLFSEVCSTLKADGIKEEFYYLYYRSGEAKGIEGKEKFCKDMYHAAHSLREI